MKPLSKKKLNYQDKIPALTFIEAIRKKNPVVHHKSKCGAKQNLTIIIRTKNQDVRRN